MAKHKNAFVDAVSEMKHFLLGAALVLVLVTIVPAFAQTPPEGGAPPPQGGSFNQPPAGGQQPPSGGQQPPSGGQQGQQPPSGGSFNQPPAGGQQPPAGGQQPSGQFGQTSGQPATGTQGQMNQGGQQPGQPGSSTGTFYCFSLKRQANAAECDAADATSGMTKPTNSPNQTNQPADRNTGTMNKMPSDTQSTERKPVAPRFGTQDDASLMNQTTTTPREYKKVEFKQPTKKAPARNAASEASRFTKNLDKGIKAIDKAEEKFATAIDKVIDDEKLSDSQRSRKALTAVTKSLRSLVALCRYAHAPLPPEYDVEEFDCETIVEDAVDAGAEFIKEKDADGAIEVLSTAYEALAEGIATYKANIEAAALEASESMEEEDDFMFDGGFGF